MRMYYCYGKIKGFPNVKEVHIIHAENRKEAQKKINSQQVVGFHWFAGHPLSQEFENNFNPETNNQYNNLLSTVVKEQV